MSETFANPRALLEVVHKVEQRACIALTRLIAALPVKPQVAMHNELLLNAITVRTQQAIFEDCFRTFTAVAFYLDNLRVLNRTQPEPCAGATAQTAPPPAHALLLNLQPEQLAHKLLTPALLKRTLLRYCTHLSCEALSDSALADTQPDQITPFAFDTLLAPHQRTATAANAEPDTRWLENTPDLQPSDLLKTARKFIP